MPAATKEATGAIQGEENVGDLNYISIM